MNIRSKLRRLLLAATLMPLLISSGVFLLLLASLGTHFASDTRKVLIEQSYGHLQALNRNTEFLIQQNFQIIDWVISNQNNELEHRFRGRQNSSGPQGTRQENLKTTSNIFVKTPDKERLKSLAEAFLRIRNKAPDLILRQHIAFNKAQGYVLSPTQAAMIPFDLSDQEWPARSFQGHANISLLVNDPQSHSLNLVIGAPSRNPDGTVWGVTAVEVPLKNLFLPLRLPYSWQSGGRVMLASVDSRTANLSIVAETIDNGIWQFPPESNVPDPSLLEASADIISGVTKGHSGITKVMLQDKIHYWAYGTPVWGGVFPLVMLEHDQAVSLALESEQHVLGKTKFGVALVGIALLVFIGLSIIAAGYFSQAVTNPVRKISHAFNQLAKGDYTVRVSINTGDEIEELSHRFNDLGGKLRDRSRMANSLALAREVQQHLLPSRPPDIPGIDLFSKGIPCDEIGGDYFDFISQKDKNKAQTGIVVGDVSGHGVPAALLMASARGILRSHAWCHDGDLAFLFQLLNKHFTKDSAQDQFMTLFYGILDRTEQTLRWNSAGHGPVFLYQAQNQTFMELETTGPPLGIDENFSYEPKMVSNLEPGDILLAGTDGLWEGRNQADEIWGIETFKDSFQRVTNRSASEIGQYLLSELTDYRNGKKQEDDISLIIAKVT